MTRTAAVVSLSVVLAACTSTRQLANPADPRLRAGNQKLGLVVPTTEPWRERIDPNTVVRFQSHAGRWTEQLAGRELYVDGDGVWTDHAVDVGETLTPRTTRVGWRWTDVQNVQVENISGGKTLGAIVGYTALAVALAPFAILFGNGGIVKSSTGGGGGGGGGGGLGDALNHLPSGGGATGPAATWDGDLARGREVDAPRLFSLGARVRAIALPTVALDTSLGLHGDLIASGVSARVRFMGLIEIGGGVRSEETRGGSLMSWDRSTTGNFQLGLHLPLDAGLRFAVPLGLDVGAGGDIACDLRFPWGLRYTSRTGRWFATVAPATPSYLHVRDAASRWGLTAGAELGASF